MDDVKVREVDEDLVQTTSDTNHAIVDAKRAFQVGYMLGGYFCAAAVAWSYADKMDVSLFMLVVGVLTMIAGHAASVVMTRRAENKLVTARYDAALSIIEENINVLNMEMVDAEMEGDVLRARELSVELLEQESNLHMLTEVYGNKKNSTVTVTAKHNPNN